MSWILAIDYGTTYTTAAIADGGAIEVLEVDGTRRLPSLVLCNESGDLVVGTAAERQAPMAPERVEATPKRYLGEEAPLLLGGEPVPVPRAVAAVLAAVYEEAVRWKGGIPPEEVRLTHPAGWQQARLAALAEAAALAGIRGPVLLPEPVGAAAFFAHERLDPGQRVAVYDLGGGTFDTAVLERTNDGYRLVGPPGGLSRMGGEVFDQRLYRHLGDVLDAEDPAVWVALSGSSEREWRLANARFLIDVRLAKEALSRDQTTALRIEAPVGRELRVSRPELEQLIDADVGKTVDEFERTIRGSGLGVGDLTGIYLAGGSSRVPLVAQRVQERFGRVPDTLQEPKEVIARGAAQADGMGVRWGTDAPAPTGGTTPPPPPRPPGPPPVRPPRPEEQPSRISVIAGAQRAGIGIAAAATLVSLLSLLVIFVPLIDNQHGSPTPGSASIWELGTDLAGYESRLVLLVGLGTPLLALALSLTWLASFRPGRHRPVSDAVAPLLVGVAGVLAGLPLFALLVDYPASIADEGLARRAGVGLGIAAAVLLAICAMAGSAVVHRRRWPPPAVLTAAATATVGGALAAAGAPLAWYTTTGRDPQSQGQPGEADGIGLGVGLVVLLAGCVTALLGIVLLELHRRRRTGIVVGVTTATLGTAGLALGLCLAAIGVAEGAVVVAQTTNRAQDPGFIGIEPGLVLATAGSLIAVAGCAVSLVWAARRR